MRTTVTQHDFIEAFENMKRLQQIGGYWGASALYDYLTDLEEDIGEEFELDVIGLCGEWSHYPTAEAAAEDCGWPDGDPGDTVVLDLGEHGVLVETH